MSEKYEQTFYIIPRRIRKLPGITFGYMDVYETIFQFWNKDLPCFLSQESLCERTGLSRTQVFEALRYFENNNELIRKSRNGRRYLIKPHMSIEINSTNIIPTSAPPDNSTNIIPTSGGADFQRPVERTMGSGGADYSIKKVNKEIDVCGEVQKLHISTPKDVVVQVLHTCAPHALPCARDDMPVIKPNPTHTQDIIINNKLNNFPPPADIAVPPAEADAVTIATEVQTLFNEKFKGRDITIEVLLRDCEEHYRGKRQVTTLLFKKWITNEKIENYELTKRKQTSMIDVEERIRLQEEHSKKKAVQSMENYKSKPRHVVDRIKKARKSLVYGVI